MIYKQIKSQKLLLFKESILSLMRLYYENPLEVFEMILKGRSAYLAIDKHDEVRCILTCKTDVKGDVLLSYIGLLLAKPKSKSHVEVLMFKHLDDLRMMSKTIQKTTVCYAQTTNFSAYVWVVKFYDNVFPNQKSQSLHPLYNEVIKLTGLNMHSTIHYKIVNSTSVARYNSKLLESISRNNKINRFPPGFSIKENEGERVLLICDLPSNEKYNRLKLANSRTWV